jgi:hypothetical protein
LGIARIPLRILGAVAAPLGTLLRELEPFKVLLQLAF